MDSEIREERRASQVHTQLHFNSSTSPSSPDIQRRNAGPSRPRRGRGRPRESRTRRIASTRSPATTTETELHEVGKTPDIDMRTAATPPEIGVRAVSADENDDATDRDMDLPVAVTPSPLPADDAIDPVETEEPPRLRQHGTGYTSDEALCVVKCWIQQCKQGASQREHALYLGISKLCAEKYGAHRTADFIRSFWSELARKCQIYLSSARSMEFRRPTGVNEELMERLIMEHYRRRAGKKDSRGNVKLAAPFKYVTAARYFETEPKFGDHVTKNVYEGGDGGGGQSGSEGISADEEQGLGVKKRKNQDEMVHEVRKSAKAMDSLVSEVKESNYLFRKSAEACERAVKNDEH